MFICVFFQLSHLIFFYCCDYFIFGVVMTSGISGAFVVSSFFFSQLSKYFQLPYFVFIVFNPCAFATAECILRISCVNFLCRFLCESYFSTHGLFLRFEYVSDVFILDAICLFFFLTINIHVNSEISGPLAAVTTETN